MRDVTGHVQVGHIFHHMGLLYGSKQLAVCASLEYLLDQEPVTEDFAPSGPYKFTRCC